MASAWAQLSKEDQKAWESTGMDKATYNDKYGKERETAPAPPTPAPTPTPSKQEQKANNQDVEERAKSTPSTSSSLLSSSRNEPITGPTFEPASSKNEPERSTAVEKTKSWADLSKEERAATGMTKKEYNRQEEDKTKTNFANPDHYAENLAQTKIRDIKDNAVGDIEKGSGDRKGWKDTLDENTSSELDQAYGTIYGKDNIEDYNFAMGGIGSLKGKEAISKADLKELQSAGFSDQEIVDHVNRERADDAYIKGDRAQRFLDKMIAGLKSSEEVVPEPIPSPVPTPTPEPVPTPTPEPVQPIEQGGGNNSTVINEGSNIITTPGSNPGSSTGTGTGGNISQIQDVNVTQGNQQEFNVNQNNDLNVAITGNNNISNVTQDNGVSNLGGNQSNFGNVTGPNTNTGGSNFLQNYLYGSGLFSSLSNAGVDIGEMLDRTKESSEKSYGYDTTTNQIQDINATQDSDQEFNVNQDNDLNAQITGDNNVSQISQDNSVRNYGGDQRNFTYISGPNANGVPNYLTDAPASMATMAGFYSPSDSPASNAAFVDRYQTMNRDAQKSYNPFGTAEGYILRGKGENVGLVDPVALKQEINLAPEIARARADMANLNAYGDIYKSPKVRWNSTLGVFEPIEPYDPVKAAEEAKNFFK